METNYDSKLADYFALREALSLPVAYVKPMLLDFVKYLKLNCPNGVVRRMHSIDWVCSSSHSESTRRLRLTAARSFLVHLKASSAETEIPEVSLLPKPRRSEPFVFSQFQLGEILSVASDLPPTNKLAPKTVLTILGLMASTGLRPGEAIRLKREHVLLHDPIPRLLIYRSKFGKTRWVPLHVTTSTQLDSYIQSHQADDSDLFFMTKDARQIRYSTLQRTFQTVIKLAGIKSRAGQLRPTLQSLRHTFAVTRMRIWYEGGADVQGLLPTLSVYLGHENPAASFWYLSSTPELMNAAAQRFEEYACVGEETT